MKILSLNLLDKITFSFRWQSNILFTVGIILITAAANALSGNWIIVALGIVSEQVFNKPLDNYDILVGVVLLLLGFYCIYRGQTALKVMKHDRPKYNNFARFADFIQTRDILQQIRTNFYYQSSQSTHLYNIQHFCEQPENTFLTKSINDKAKTLRNKLNCYHSFRVTNFFIYPSNQTQPDPTFWLQPGLDINKELLNSNQQTADKLEAIRNELVQKTKDVEDALTDIILTAKNKLGI